MRRLKKYNQNVRNYFKLKRDIKPYKRTYQMETNLLDEFVEFDAEIVCGCTV